MKVPLLLIALTTASSIRTRRDTSQHFDASMGQALGQSRSEITLEIRMRLTQKLLLENEQKFTRLSGGEDFLTVIGNLRRKPRRFKRNRTNRKGRHHNKKN